MESKRVPYLEQQKIIRLATQAYRADLCGLLSPSLAEMRRIIERSRSVFGTVFPDEAEEKKAKAALMKDAYAVMTSIQSWKGTVDDITVRCQNGLIEPLGETRLSDAMHTSATSGILNVKTKIESEVTVIFPIVGHPVFTAEKYLRPAAASAPKQVVDKDLEEVVHALRQVWSRLNDLVAFLAPSGEEAHVHVQHAPVLADELPETKRP